MSYHRMMLPPDDEKTCLDKTRQKSPLIAEIAYKLSYTHWLPLEDDEWLPPEWWRMMKKPRSLINELDNCGDYLQTIVHSLTTTPNSWYDFFWTKSKARLWQAALRLAYVPLTAWSRSTSVHPISFSVSFYPSRPSILHRTPWRKRVRFARGPTIIFPFFFVQCLLR